MEKVLLFIYGRYARGGVRHERLGGAEFLGEVRSEPRYRYFKVREGAFVGLAEVPADGLAVRGELYSISVADLAALDEMLAPTYYRRASIAVPGLAAVEAYYWTGVIADGAKSGDDWRFTNPPLPELG